MNRTLRRFMISSAVLCALSLTSVLNAQETAATEAWRRLQLSSEQLVALYLEAVAIHNGFAYTIDFARFQDCSAAQTLATELDAPSNWSKKLHQITKTSRISNRFLFAMEPELREQIRSMSDGERTGLVTLAGGDCLIAEVVEYQQKPMLDPKELGPLLPLAVDRGWLPHPDLLSKDPALRSRTLANKIRTVADLEAVPAEFDVNTRRSDGYTTLTHALLLNHTDVARAALKRGADPNLCGPRYCPIELAIALHDSQQARELLDSLLQAGADPNQVDLTQRARLLPLANAAAKDLDLVERLIKAGAKPNGIPDTAPPLFFAAANGKRETVEYLLAQGADVFARDTSRPGPPNTLYTAARGSKDPVLVDWIEKRMLDAATKSDKYKCELWFEQDGRRVPAIGGAYHLNRAPFRIVVRVPEAGLGGVMIASAQTPIFQQDVRDNVHESAIFRPVSTAAEEAEGKSDWLDVLPASSSSKDATTQYWFWTNDTERRFTGRRGAGRATEYYKDIRAIGLDRVSSGAAGFQPVPVSEYAGEDIYLVAAVPVELSIFDQRFVDPVLIKLTFTDSTRRASR